MNDKYDDAVDDEDNGNGIMAITIMIMGVIFFIIFVLTVITIFASMHVICHSPDPATLAEINEFAIPVKEYTENVIGETYVFLNGETPICRTVECNMGNVVTDAMLEDLVTYQNEDSWSDVAISIMNGGGIRASIAQGKYHCPESYGMQCLPL